MKIQKTIIYIVSVITIISFIAYIYCVFVWNVPEGEDMQVWQSCISNIAVGIFGSSIVSAIIAMITYFQERCQLLDRYLNVYKKLFEHCSKFSKESAYQEKICWFNTYKDLSKDLEELAEKIAFFIDLRGTAKYLKSIAEYYVEFTLLTQSAFFDLEEKRGKTDQEKEELCKFIDNVVIEVESENRGILTYNIEHNRLTYNKELVLKSISEINTKPFKYLFKKNIFNQTLVTQDVFCVLDEVQEAYVKKIIKEMRKTNSGNIEIEVPNDICEVLLKKKYLYRYSSGSGSKKKLDCQFILYHYFRLKGKLKTNDEKNKVALNIYSNLYTSVCFLVSLLLFYVQNTFSAYEKIANICIITIILLTVILQKMIKRLLENNVMLMRIIDRVVIKLADLSIIMCFVSAIAGLGGFSNDISYLYLIYIGMFLFSLWAVVSSIIKVKREEQ